MAERACTKVRHGKWVSFLLVSGLILGCAPSGSRQGGSKPAKGIVVSPLSVEVADPAKLLSVNSIVVEKPTFTSASKSRASEDSLRVVVEEVAAESLSMKIVGMGRSKGAASERADGVLKTEVLTMEELKGSAVGGEPARVAFRIGVYPTGGSRPVWQAHYVYSQEAVADNWLRLGERLGSEGTGAGWITAEQIFKRGVTASLRDFNQRRDAQFQSRRGGR